MERMNTKNGGRRVHYHPARALVLALVVCGAGSTASVAEAHTVVNSQPSSAVLIIDGAPVPTQPAAVDISGPCVGTNHCSSGVQSDPNKVIATVTVTPEAPEGFAALKPDGIGDVDWMDTGITLHTTDQQHGLLVKFQPVDGQATPEDTRDWWKSDTAGPASWNVLLFRQTRVEPGTYTLTLLGASYGS